MQRLFEFPGFQPLDQVQGRLRWNDDGAHTVFGALLLKACHKKQDRIFDNT